MSSRVFQSIVLQMKECTDRVIGVVDAQGTVVSCNQLSRIGEKWEGAASALNVNESPAIIYGDKTFKPLSSRGSHFDYAAFVQGSDEQAKLICSMVTVALNSAKAYYTRKSTTRRPSSRASFPTTSFWVISMSAPRSSTLPPRPSGPSSWFVRWVLRRSPLWMWFRTCFPTARRIS